MESNSTAIVPQKINENTFFIRNANLDWVNRFYLPWKNDSRRAQM